MMGERTVAHEALFYSPDRHVPTDHLLRSIDWFVDLSDNLVSMRPTAFVVHLEQRTNTLWSLAAILADRDAMVGKAPQSRSSRQACFHPKGRPTFIRRAKLDMQAYKLFAEALRQFRLRLGIP
jgi:hypothetical protein